MLSAFDVKPIEVAFLGPFAVDYVRDKVCAQWAQGLTIWLSQAAGEGWKVRLRACDPPFDVPESVDGKGYWMKPVHTTSDGRRKLLRKQIFTSVVHALGEIVKQQARVVVGVGQGGLVCILLGLPLVVEAACRARIVTDRELLDFRRAWSGVVGLIASDPIMLQQRPLWPELQAAIPELTMIQPCGVPRIVFVGDSFLHKDYAMCLATAAGTTSVSPGDPCAQNFWAELARSLCVEPPVYIEDDIAGSGCCVVCGKRGALGRCPTCGLLMHFGCVLPSTPGGELSCQMFKNGRGYSR